MKLTPRDIKNQALAIKKNKPDLKLTQIQHSIVQQHGYKTYQAFYANYEKEYKRDEQNIFEEIKVNLFKNNKQLLGMFEKIIKQYKKSEDLLDIYYETDQEEDKDKFDESQDKAYAIIHQIGHLVQPKDCYIQYNHSVFTFPSSFHFTFYYDAIKMSNDTSGNMADYTLVLHFEEKEVELYEKNELDGIYFKFPQV